MSERPWWERPGPRPEPWDQPLPIADPKRCAVCGDPIDDDDPHTFHAEGCPLRDPDPHSAPTPEDCAQLAGCGEDVHEQCCPTCTGQAFDVKAPA